MNTLGKPVLTPGIPVLTPGIPTEPLVLRHFLYRLLHNDGSGRVAAALREAEDAHRKGASCGEGDFDAWLDKAVARLTKTP